MNETLTPLLQLRGITKSFGSVQALTDVDFDVQAGGVTRVPSIPVTAGVIA